jgi:beta-lactamase class A
MQAYEAVPAPFSLARTEGIPDSPAGRQLAWLVQIINRSPNAIIDDADVAAHFHADFFKESPRSGISTTVRNLAQTYAPVMLLDVGQRQPERLIALTKTANGNTRIRITIDQSTGLIKGLRLIPYLSFADADADIRALAPRGQLLIAEVEGQKCRPIHGFNPDESLAIGSTFKLYVLLALVDHILAGKASWATPVPIREEWKSLPFGTMQKERQGARFPLRIFAEKMISISDNSATDHIIHTIGRESVEAALTTAHHHQPEANIPFLSTREFFLFNRSLQPDVTERYMTSTEGDRRWFLENVLAIRSAYDSADDDGMISHYPAQVGWFASAADICNVMAILWGRAHTSSDAAPLLDILSVQPGVTVSPGIWPFVGYKAGWWHGLRSLTWLLRRSDDRVFIIVLGFNDPSGAEIDKGRVFALAYAIFELLADEGR